MNSYFCKNHQRAVKSQSKIGKKIKGLIYFEVLLRIIKVITIIKTIITATTAQVTSIGSVVEFGCDVGVGVDVGAIVGVGVTVDVGDDVGVGIGDAPLPFESIFVTQKYSPPPARTYPLSLD